MFRLDGKSFNPLNRGGGLQTRNPIGHRDRRRLFQSPKSGRGSSDPATDECRVWNENSFNPLNRGGGLQTMVCALWISSYKKFQSPKSGRGSSDFRCPPGDSLGFCFNPLNRGGGLQTLFVEADGRLWQKFQSPKSGRGSSDQGSEWLEKNGYKVCFNPLNRGGGLQTFQPLCKRRNCYEVSIP